MATGPRAGSRAGAARRSAIVAAAAALLSLAAAPLLHAQSAGFQEFFVLGNEQHVWNFMDRVRQGEGAGAFPAPARMNSVVTATATVAGQIVYYDHWEDGFEANIAAPVQATTLVLGDGNVNNGRACDFTSDARVAPCNGNAAHDDALFAGTYLVFNSDQGVGAGCTQGLPMGPFPPATPVIANLFCSVPVNPRVTTDVRFDGGDRVFTSGSSLTIAHVQDPGTPLIGGGTELLARTLVQPALSYSVPVGENLYPGANNAFLSTRYVSLDLVAFDDNTQVTVTSPGAGSVSFTLNRGQHYSSCAAWLANGPPQTCTAGAIDNAAAPGIQINSGTKVSTTGPLNGLMFTGGPNQYATRHYALLPDILHSTDYVVTAPGDDPAVQGSRPLNLYIFNPDPTTAITVNTFDSVGAATINIPPNSVVDYRNGVGRNVPNNSTVRLTSTRNFWGVSAYGYSDQISDWGHSWLATRFLTNDYTIAYSPGTQSDAVTSITRAGTTATVTTAIPHFLANGATARISGANQAAYNGTFTITVTGANTFTYTVAGAPATPATGVITAFGVCDVGASGTGVGCNSYNRDPVWVAGTQDNTQVRIDLDNDGLWDYVDTNSDNCPDDGNAAFSDAACQTPPVVAGCPALTPGRCVYRVDAPGTAGGNNSLRVFDYTDLNNAGTRVFANKPVALSWGQDVDQGQPSDPSPDNGYTVYPLTDLAIDPALSIAKTSDVSRVPLGGGPVTYTLTVRSGSFGPMTSLQVTDLLPAGIPGTAYAAGSTLITYPDLSQGTNDPTVTAVGGRDQLQWALSPNTLQANQTLTIRYTVNIPAFATARLLTNNATAQANLGGSVFRARATASVAQSAVNLVKSVVDDNGGQPEAGDTLTYTLVVTNNGVAAETGVSISDAIPAFASFLGPVTGTAPFTGAFNAAQNSVVWTNSGGPFAAGASATLTFKVTINPGAPALSVVSNKASYSSNQTPLFDSNTVNTTVVGPVLEQSKSGPSLLAPGEIASFEILVRNTGAGAATNVLIRDALASTNMTYVPASMRWSLDGGAFVALTDANDADQGTLTGTTLQFLLASLGPGGEIRFRFQAQVNAGTGGLFATNQATVSATQVSSQDTNLLQIPIGNATVAGHLFLDLDGNGTQDAGEPNLPNVTVVLTSAAGGSRTLVTDANGNYSAVMPPGTVTADVDQADPDIPPGSTLTTANDPQNVTAIANNTVATTPVGYRPPPVQITKTSNAGGTVVAGQTVTYTVTVTNNTGTTQTGITVNDVVPANTTYVDNSAQVSYTTGNPLRVTEYYIDNAAPDQCTQAGTDFPAGNTSCTLTLNQALSPNYFVIIQGSADTTSDSGPDNDYVSLTNDGVPDAINGGTGTGDFTGGIGANQITLTRQGSGNAWIGVVTVVECLSDCATNGFSLLDVQRVAHAGGGTSGSDTSSVAWPAGAPRIMLMGGVNGAGCDTADSTATDHEVCHVRLFPSGTNTINWTRDATSGGLSSASSTVMVLEWGTAWTVQRTQITNGNSGGDQINVAGEYNTVGISAVASAQTWVWGTGHTNDDGSGDSAEGVALTLGPVAGNPLVIPASASQIAAGIYFNNNAINFDVYALTHPSLLVDHDFKPDGDTGGGGAQTVNVTTNSATANRMAFSTNGVDDTGNNFPRSLFSARYTSNTQITLERRRSNDAFAAWVQGVNFGGMQATQTVTCLSVYPPAAGQCTQPTTNSNVVDPAAGFTIPSGASLTLTFQVTVNNPLAPGVTQIANTATLTTTQQPTPRSATATDNVFRPGVSVEPNNAGFVTPGGAITFQHTVTNTGSATDNYTLTLTSQRGYTVELIDPITGMVVATDSNGDGVWDGGITVKTGSLASGATKNYLVRVSVPAGATPGTEDTVVLNGVSSYGAQFRDDAKDELTVLPSGGGNVLVTPDNSGVVAAGQTTWYAHRVFNNTGAADTFDLRVDSTLGWTTTVYGDSNGDGVYTPGVDLPIANTAQIPNGGSQLVFVVTTAPGGASGGTRDVAQLLATSRTSPGQFFGTATDTTTVTGTPGHDLSGGGTRIVAPGQTAIFPGSMNNTGTSVDRLELSISAAGLFGADGLAHPTELWIDTDADDIPDTLIAVDSDGDGTWDRLCGSFSPPATSSLPCSAATFNDDGDAFPDVSVAAGGSVAYELRRAVPAGQRIPRDFVTLTQTSVNNPSLDPDSVTATWLFAAATRASIRGVRVDAAGLVEFATGTQRGTKAFNLYSVSGRRDATPLLLNAEPIPAPVADSLMPILYRARTEPLTQPFLLIEEIETSGNRLVKGPFRIDDQNLRREFERIERRLDRQGVAQGDARQARPLAKKKGDAAKLQRLHARRSRSPEGVRIEVADAGVVTIPMADLAAAGLPGGADSGGLRLTNLGRAIPFDVVVHPSSGTSLRFRAEDLSTDYTGDNVYLLTRGGKPFPMQVSLTRSADAPLPGFLRGERNTTYLANAPIDADPWLWDVLVSDGSAWPFWWDPTGEWGQFDLPGLLPGQSGPAAVRVRLVGDSNHRHSVEAWINGASVGTLTFEGNVTATLQGSLSRELLRPAGNQLQFVYSAVRRDNGAAVGDGYVYLDYVDVAAAAAPPANRVAVAGLTPYDASLPDFKKLEYLVVTHPDFRAAADRIAALKQADGLRAAVVETDNAYDRYSGGVTEARAIQAVIRDAAAQSGRLKYVLLVGDDTLDPQNYVWKTYCDPQQPEACFLELQASFVPSLLSRDSGFGWIPSENRYADLDDDGAPELAIGRLPVQTPAQAEAMADKIANQAALLAAPAGRHSFAVDNSGPLDAPFRAEAEEMAALVRANPASSPFADISQGIGQARTTLFSAWRAGAMLTHYFGHGGPEIWADEHLLTVGDVSDQGASFQPSVVLMWACDSQWYLNLWGPSLGEALMLAPNGGALASFGPAGITPPARHRVLYERVYGSLLGRGLTLGETIRRAKADALEADPNVREVIDGYNLMGDPALRLP